jgi:hypothetical protein
MVEFIRSMETADVGREVGLLDALPSEQMKKAWIAQMLDPQTEEELAGEAELREAVGERDIAQRIRDEDTPFSPEERALAAFDAVEGRRDDEERLDRGRRAFGDEDQGLVRSPGDYLLLPPQGNEPGGPMPQDTFLGGGWKFDYDGDGGLSGLEFDDYKKAVGSPIGLDALATVGEQVHPFGPFAGAKIFPLANESWPYQKPHEEALAAFEAARPAQEERPAVADAGGGIGKPGDMLAPPVAGGGIPQPLNDREAILQAGGAGAGAMPGVAPAVVGGVNAVAGGFGPAELRGVLGGGMVGMPGPVNPPGGFAPPQAGVARPQAQMPLPQAPVGGGVPPRAANIKLQGELGGGGQAPWGRTDPRWHTPVRIPDEEIDALINRSKRDYSRPVGYQGGDEGVGYSVPTQASLPSSAEALVDRLHGIAAAQGAGKDLGERKGMFNMADPKLQGEWKAIMRKITDLGLSTGQRRLLNLPEAYYSRAPFKKLVDEGGPPRKPAPLAPRPKPAPVELPWGQPPIG